MRILISGGCRQTLVNIRRKYPYLCRYMGWINSPRHSYSDKSIKRIGISSMCLDNAAFSNWCEESYLKMLDKWADAIIPIEWVTLPDVVGDAHKTNQLFGEWYEKVSLPRAYVAQDGAEDLELPFAYFKCLFIGGTTDWKLSRSAESVIQEGKRQNKVIHMGRVNSQKRMRYAYQLGCDSVDGTGYSKYNKIELLKFLEYVHTLHNQIFLEF